MAIAVSNSPKILLADEPTGAVDTHTAEMIMDSFRELNKSLGVTIVIVTHDMLLAKKVNRVVAIRDGRTSSEFTRKSYKDEMKNLRIADEDEEKEEFAVVDRFGRLQIPAEYLEALGLKGKNKLKIDLENGKIVIKAP